MNYGVLYWELKLDPAGIGHVEHNNPAWSASAGDAETQEVVRTSISGDELLEATKIAELMAFSPPWTAAYWGLAAKETLSVAVGTNTRILLAALFPDGSVTRQNLITLLGKKIKTSRWVILGLGDVRASDVLKAWTQGEAGGFGDE